MGVQVFNGFILYICEVYIDDILFQIIIAVEYTNETVVDCSIRLVEPQDKMWLVWRLTDPTSENLERYDKFKKVDAFRHYCVTNKLDPFLL